MTTNQQNLLVRVMHLEKQNAELVAALREADKWIAKQPYRNGHTGASEVLTSIRAALAKVQP